MHFTSLSFLSTFHRDITGCAKRHKSTINPPILLFKQKVELALYTQHRAKLLINCDPSIGSRRRSAFPPPEPRLFPFQPSSATEGGKNPHKHASMCAWGGGHRVEGTLLRRQRGVRHCRTGAAASPFTATGRGHAGGTKLSLPPLLPTLSPTGTAAPVRGVAAGSHRARPRPAEGGPGGAGRGHGGLCPQHRAAPRRRSATHRAARAPPSRAERCAGRRCRGGGSGGGRRWRANRGPARRRESPAGAQGGRAAAIRAPQGRPPHRACLRLPPLLLGSRPAALACPRSLSPARRCGWTGGAARRGGGRPRGAGRCCCCSPSPACAPPPTVSAGPGQRVG